jgi:hypothetical protein
MSLVRVNSAGEVMLKISDPSIEKWALKICHWSSQQTMQGGEQLVRRVGLG